jgi:HSP20 family protein
MFFNRSNGLFGNLFAEMNRVRTGMDRFFERFGDEGQGVGPLLNLWEDDENLYAEADLPDVQADKLEVLVNEGNQLTIQGERKAPEIKNAVWHRQERPHGQFVRTITLPMLVDADKVEARFEQGVLKLTLPKSAAAKPRKINVKGT